MSLKAFHILFVIICVAFTVGFGFWAIREYQRAGELATLLMGIGSFAAALGLLVYGRYFLRKLREVSYL